MQHLDTGWQAYPLHRFGKRDRIWIKERPVPHQTPRQPAECRTAGLKPGVGGGFATRFPRHAQGYIGITKDGSKAYASVQEGGCIKIYEIALTGKESYKAVVDGQRSASLADMHADQLLFIADDFLRTADLYTLL